MPMVLVNLPMLKDRMRYAKKSGRSSREGIERNGQKRTFGLISEFEADRFLRQQDPEYDVEERLRRDELS